MDVTSGNLSGGTRVYVPTRESVNVKARGHVAEWLRYKMKVRRLNIRATAETMGVSAAAVSRVKSGDRTPGFDFVLKFSETFAVPLEVLAYSDPPRAVTGIEEPTGPISSHRSPKKTR